MDQGDGEKDREKDTDQVSRQEKIMRSFGAMSGSGITYPPSPSFGGLGMEWGGPSHSGVGDLAPTTQKLVMSTPQITGSVLSALALHGAIWSAAAIPIIGAAVVGVTLALSLLFGRKGPKQKRLTTQIVNDVEPHLISNLQGYLSGPHTRSSQQQALANFDAAWQWLIEHCETEALGDPGKNCIKDRQSGACQWKNDGHGGPAGSGTTCWNWFVGYRDPIANDPNVVPDPPFGADVFAVDAGQGSILGGGAGGLLLPALLIGGVLLWWGTSK